LAKCETLSSPLFTLLWWAEPGRLIIDVCI